MRFLLFSDPHITTKAEFSKPTTDGLTEYLHRVIDSFVWVGTLVEEYRPDFVAMLGDLFDTTGFVETSSLQVASRICSDLDAKCKQFSIPLYWLVGNHDAYSVNHHIHNLSFLKDGWGRVIERPEVITTPVENLGLCPVYFLPWPGEDNPDALMEARFVLSHIEVKGGFLNAKAKSESGYDPTRAPDIWMFNGHYHMPGKVGNRCYMVGSLLSRSFVEGPSEVRGAMFVDYDGMGECVIERISNPHEIPYRTVEILSPEEATLWSQRLEEGMTGLEESYARIIYDDLYAEEAEKVSYLTQGARLEQRSEIAATVPDEFISETFSPEENFRNYVDNVVAFDEDGDEEAILEKGIQYIKSAKTKDRVATQPIEFQHLQIENFQAIEHAEIDLSDQGLVWIGGENGSGKTTLLEALVWAVTGRSPRFGDRPGDDVIGWHSALGCLVKVNMKIGGATYKIIRGRKPARLELWFEDTEITARRIKDTEAELAALIGRSKDVLQHSIFLTSGLDTRFTALSYPERIRLVEDITDAGIYASIEQIAKKDAKKAWESYYSVEGAIKSLEGTLNLMTERLQTVNGELLEAKRVQTIELESLKSSLRCAVEERDRLAGSLHEAEQGCVESREQEAAIRDSMSGVKKRELQIREKVSSLGAEINHARCSLQEKKNVVTEGRCPLCLSEDVGVTLGKYISAHEEAIERKLEVHKALLDKLEEIKAEIEAKEVERKKADDRLLSLSLKKEELYSSHQKVELQVEGIKREMLTARSSSDSLQARQSEIKNSIAVNTLSLQERTEEKKQLEKDTRVHDFLARAFSTQGIRARMLSTITIPYLNSRIKVYSSLLGMFCEMTTKVEKKGKQEDKVEIVLPGNRTYKSCSRGERRRVDLAVQCAINDLAIATGGSKVNLLVADEVIDPLDDLGVSAFLDVLKEKVTVQGASVFLITHKQFLESQAMQRWYITKENGISHLEVVG